MAAALKELEARGIKPSRGAYMVPHQMFKLSEARTIVLFGTNQVDSITVIYHANRPVSEQETEEIDSTEF